MLSLARSCSYVQRAKNEDCLSEAAPWGGLISSIDVLLRLQRDSAARSRSRQVAIFKIDVLSAPRHGLVCIMIAAPRGTVPNVPSWHLSAVRGLHHHGSCWRSSGRVADIAEPTRLTRTGHRLD